MIKSLLIAFLSVFVYTIGCTQTSKEIIELNNQLAIAKTDTNLIKAQINLCYVYRLGNTDSSLFFGQQALRLVLGTKPVVKHDTEFATFSETKKPIDTQFISLLLLKSGATRA